MVSGFGFLGITTSTEVTLSPPARIHYFCRCTFRINLYNCSHVIKVSTFRNNLIFLWYKVKIVFTFRNSYSYTCNLRVCTFRKNFISLFTSWRITWLYTYISIYICFYSFGIGGVIFPLWGGSLLFVTTGNIPTIGKVKNEDGSLLICSFLFLVLILYKNALKSKDWI